MGQQALGWCSLQQRCTWWAHVWLAGHSSIAGPTHMPLRRASCWQHPFQADTTQQLTTVLTNFVPPCCCTAGLPTVAKVVSRTPDPIWPAPDAPEVKKARTKPKPQASQQAREQEHEQPQEEEQQQRQQEAQGKGASKGGKGKSAGGSKGTKKASRR